VEEGLQAGEMVVTDGHLRLTQGSKVELREAGKPATRPGRERGRRRGAEPTSRAATQAATQAAAEAAPSAATCEKASHWPGAVSTRGDGGSQPAFPAPSGRTGA
jgi:hypothetical protein